MDTPSVQEKVGTLYRISGPTVWARGLERVSLYDVVYVGEMGLLGEVVRIHEETCVIQVYEDTQGLRPGEPVVHGGGPLTVELGPGLLGAIFDGIQRPLTQMAQRFGDWIGRGWRLDPLDPDRTWPFHPQVREGEEVRAGDLLGIIPREAAGVEHRVLLPPGLGGRIREIREGSFRLRDPIGFLEDGTPLFLSHRWPVRRPRPVLRKLPLTVPFVTGQRVLDTLFPIPVGGSVILPGGFGTGKTVLEHALAKYVQADVVIYVGCGERGNEITEVLEDFPRLEDPYTGRPLMERTILVVNTSNMPVAAREASIFTGVTLAEYYRDMGYHVAFLADSTSRWAEALREIASRLEEMPGEEGYPTTLGSRLAQFYGRAGRVVCLGREEREGAITICAAVSPPGGDFSEPVTQASMRVSGAMWALDFRLAHQRHFPAVHWGLSYSLFAEGLRPWFEQEVDPLWPQFKHRLARLLQEEEGLLQVAQLVGPDALQDRERLTLAFCRMAREYYLRQSARSEADAYCPLRKQFWMLRVLFYFQDRAEAALEEGRSMEEIPLDRMAKALEGLRESPPQEVEDRARALIQEEW